MTAVAEDIKQNRDDLIQTYAMHQRELLRQQRKYKKIISTKYLNRKESIGQASYLKSIEQLKAEKNDVKAQIWVANGRTHLRTNDQRLRNIKCHVACQEALTAENKKLKIQIQVLELQLKRTEKTIYELNRKTIPDNQYQLHVKKVRRTRDILENQLEVSVKRECSFTASNRRLREDIVRMINFRTFFNDLYTKMIQRLKSDNKYLTDLIEYAQMTFESNINVYEKIIALNKKESHDRELRKVEMQSLIRKEAQDNDNFEFLAKKDQTRELEDLEPREYKRRNLFTQAHQRKIKLYKTVLDKILAHSNTDTVDKVIENFQEQESLYYSYFNYANEKNYHITMLNTTLNDMYNKIKDIREKNNSTMEKQLETIAALSQKLEEQEATNASYEAKKATCNKTLDEFFKDLLAMFTLTRANTAPLKKLLGNHTVINIMNIKEFLMILENRLNQIISRVYIIQRRDPKLRPTMYVVRNLQKICDEPTPLDNIVLVQQCPECAEGEAVNTDVTDCVIEPLTEIKAKLHEKVVQPEMQYRLHSLTDCRLQRSRMLANSKL